MKDCIGRELQVGDSIAYCDMHYADLNVGKITRFTAKKCCVTGSRSINRFQGLTETTKYPWQIIKIEYDIDLPGK